MPPAEARELNGMGTGLVKQTENSFDIEDPQRPEEPDTDGSCVDRCGNAMFPIEDISETPIFKYGFCCFICPPMVKGAFFGCFPRRIMGFTHLALMVGILAGLFLVVFTGIYVVPGIGPNCWGTSSFFCAKELVTLAYCLSSVAYFYRCIQQFDVRMQERSKQIEKQKEQLVGAFNDTIKDLGGLLEQSTESSAGLAERNFQSKKRDFERFLKTMKGQGQQLGVRTEEEMKQLTDEFKTMIVNWLKVFQECSANPTGNPLVILKDGELEQLDNIFEVVDLVLDRLKVNDVRFLSAKKDNDQKMIEGRKKDVGALANEDVAAKPMFRRTMVMRMKVAKKRIRLPAWIVIGRGGSDAPTVPMEGEHFPKELSCGCCSLVVLSREHLSLMLGLIAGICLIPFDLTSGNRNPVFIILTFLMVVSLTLLLARFEEVDAIQTLEREVRQLQAKTEKVQKESEEIKEFWEEVQQVADIWLYRTVPRLDLHKEVHVCLEDSKSGKDLLKALGQANQGFAYIEDSIGEVGLWHGKQGQLTKDTKTSFQKALNNAVTNISDNQDVSIIAKTDMKQLTYERKSIKPLAPS